MATMLYLLANTLSARTTAWAHGVHDPEGMLGEFYPSNPALFLFVKLFFRPFSPVAVLGILLRHLPSPSSGVGRVTYRLLTDMDPVAHTASGPD